MNNIETIQETGIAFKKEKKSSIYLWVAFYFFIPLILIVSILTLKFIYKDQGDNMVLNMVNSFIETEFLIFILVGFIAQMIDGALGMAYGVSSTSFLMSVGVGPAAASAAVHVAEVFTTGASGLSHWKLGNVNKKLTKALIIPGIIGAIIGSYILSSFDGKFIKPYVSLYLVVMGVIIIKKALAKKKKKKKSRRIIPLAFSGAFLDSIGGGGWGPVVTSTLIGKGRSPKYTIGSVNLAEFFVALASAGTFTLMLGIDSWKVIVGLILGGIFAAPIGALVAGKLKTKPLMLFVGALIIFLSIRTIVLAWF